MSRAIAAALLLVAFQAAAVDAPGVVGIYTSSGNVGGQGTGFVISASGEVATAYHVIHGAQRIDVVWGGNKFSDVVIARTYPEVDIAVLRISPLPAGLTPLRMAAKHKAWAAGDVVQVFGYARGIPNQRFDGTVTQNGVWTSQQIRDEQQRRLFVVDGLDLVPLDLTAYSGLSGGPILRGGEVIGIFSGSLGQGRGIAWGIPVAYLPMAKPIERRASQMSGWPGFAMTKDWSTLRSSFRLDSAAARLIDEYFVAVDGLVANNDELATKIRITRASVMVARRLLEDATARAPGGVPSSSDVETVVRLLAPNMDMVAKAYIHSGEVESKIQNALGRIAGYVQENYSGLPRTALNLQAFEEVRASGRELTRRRAALRKQDQLDPAIMDALQTWQQADAVGQRDRATSAALYLSGVRKFEAFLADDSGIAGVQRRNSTVRHYRDIGEYVQSVFSRPQDFRSEPRSYSSHRHAYTVTYPRGWVEWSPELARHIPLPPLAGIDMYFIRTGFFGEDRAAADIPILATNSDIRPAIPVDDRLIALLRTEFEAGARSSLRRLRNVTATRATFGPHSAVLIQGVFDTDIGPAWVHNALVLGPGRMVWVNCSYGTASDIDDCRSITRSVQFN